MKKISVGMLMLLVFLLISYRGVAYIPTAAQILEPILKANQGIRDLKIELKTIIFDERYDEGRKKIDERVYVKKSGKFRSERTFAHWEDIIISCGGRTLAVMSDEADIAFRKIDTVLPIVCFSKSSDDLIKNLNHLCVDTRSVAFDRIDRKVTYVIGKKSGSQLWINKETGFPVRFVGIGTSDERRVILRAEYRDYSRERKSFWFPRRIEFYKDDILWVVSRPVKIHINKGISDGFFKIPEEKR